MKHTAIYVRVSSKAQDLRSQLPDLERWAEAFADSDEVQWYRDTASGKSMDRPAWNKLETAMRAGQVTRVVCWRLDRLGRTASGLTALFDELQSRKVGLVSIRDGVDLETANGRLMACVLASVSAYENEVRSERIRAGQAAAKAQGKSWGGWPEGKRRKVRAEQIAVVKTMREQGAKIAAIARATSLSRVTIYSIVNGELASA